MRYIKANTGTCIYCFHRGPGFFVLICDLVEFGVAWKVIRNRPEEWPLTGCSCVAWYGLARHVMEWHGMALHGDVYCMVGMEWNRTERNGMERNGTERNGAERSGAAQENCGDCAHIFDQPT